MGPLRSWTMASATSRAAAARRCHEARHRCECGASSSPSVADGKNRWARGVRPSMTTPADRSIAVLRATHDDLAALVPGLTDEQLTGLSGASEWTVAQVLSHMGSGAEIGLATLERALAAGPAADPGFNQSVWDRWSAMALREQAAGFLDHDARLVTAFEALTADQRST